MSSVLQAAGWEPHDGQREFLESEAKIKVLACGRRWGKTDACAASIVQALQHETPTKHVIIAPTLDQARLLFDRVVEMLKGRGNVRRAEGRKDGSGRKRANQAESHSVDSQSAPHFPKPRYTPYPRLTYNDHVVTARSGYLGRLLRGNEANHIVIDEAAFVPEDLITEVAMPMLATTGGKLTLISTPRGKNHFWRFFEMGRKCEYGVWSRRAPSMESPFVKREYLAIQKEIISERAFLTEYEAEFMETAGRIFRTEAIDGCLRAELPRQHCSPYFIGVDFGRHRDYTAVAVVCGTESDAMLVEATRIAHLGMSEQLDHVAAIIARYPAALVVCDSTGMQDSYVVELRKKGLRAGFLEFVFTAKSKGPLIDKLVSMIDHRRLTMLPNVELIRELEHFEAEDTEHGHTKYGAPSGFHDDLVIALALATWELRAAPCVPRLGGKREHALKSA